MGECDTYLEFLSAELQRSVYGGEGRHGGSFTDRASKIRVWKARPANLEYYPEKWNEFLAA